MEPPLGKKIAINTKTYDHHHQTIKNKDLSWTFQYRKKQIFQSDQFWIDEPLGPLAQVGFG